MGAECQALAAASCLASSLWEDLAPPLPGKPGLSSLYGNMPRSSTSWGGGVSCTCAFQGWQEWSTSGRDWFSDRPEGQSKVHSSCSYFFSICLAVSNGEGPRPNLMRFCTSFPPNHNTFPPFLPRVTIRWDNCISCFLIATHRS